MIHIALALVLSQAPAASPATDGGSAMDAGSTSAALQDPVTQDPVTRAAVAAEKAAEAAQKSADAAVQIATALKPPAPPPVCVPPPPPPPSPWTVAAGLGLISLTGNSDSLSANANANVSLTLSDWVFSGKASGTYGQSRPSPGTPDTVLAEQGTVQLRLDRHLTELVAVYALTGVDTDHVASIEYRANEELGLSLFWWNTKAADGSERYLRTDLGMRYSKESQFQYFPTPEALPEIDFLGPRLGLELHYGLTQSILFIQTAEAMTNVYGASQTLVNTLSKLSIRVMEKLAVGASFTVNYNSAPAPGKVPTDTALAITLDYKT